jgi:beta-glucosidase
LLSWIDRSYQTSIYIIENGTTAPGEDVQAPPSNDVFNDTHRIVFLDGYLESVARAVKEDGGDVRSHFARTFTDNW